MEPADGQPGGAGLDGIETVKQQVLPGQRQPEADDGGDAEGEGDVALADAEQVAEEDVVEMDVRVDRDIGHQPDAEHPREDHPEDGVGFDAAVAGEVARRERAGHARPDGADEQGRAEKMGEDDAGQDRVADGVPHQGPALEDEETGQQRRRHRDDEGNEERLLHEGELERQNEGLPVHHWSPPAGSACERASDRAASRPCLGANRKAAMKARNWRVTIIPPVAPSRK